MNNFLCELIDAAIDRDGRAGRADQKRRRYLGGSQMGQRCNRKTWYGFHWAIRPKFKARLLRLFDRGHREEERFVEWLHIIGVEVQEVDPDTIPMLWYHAESESYIPILPLEFAADPTNAYHLSSQCEDVSGTWHEGRARAMGVIIPEPRQFSWTAIDGHHMGNTDGRARFVPGQEQWGILPTDWILTEFKTHNDKSFKNLIELQSVYQSKYEHYVQMQRYMRKTNMILGLYGAVNKNDDELYFEFVPIDYEIEIQLDTKAIEAIYSEKPPERISTSPSWFECKFCDFRPQCHFGAPLDKNCRSCSSSTPVADGRWRCSRWDKLIPKEAEEFGCDFYKQRND